MKVFGHPVSTCTRKVLTTLHELDLAYDLEVVDLTKGEHKQPAHLARQPFGQIPAIDDDGFTMYESRAICRYLVEKAKGPLVPRHLEDRARMEQWISIEASNFSGHAMKFIFEYVFGREQAAAVLGAAQAGLTTALGVMEERLASTAYFAGETFSLADICFLPYVEYLSQTPIGRSLDQGHPHVAAWFANVRARPSWRAVTGLAAKAA